MIVIIVQTENVSTIALKLYHYIDRYGLYYAICDTMDAIQPRLSILKFGWVSGGAS